MPEHLKALVVILVVATAVFAFARVPACASAMSARDFTRRRNLWLGITLAAFLAHQFWIYVAVVAALLYFAVPMERNRLAMFYFLLFAVPLVYAPISGLGLIEHLFAIDYLRLLSLTILLPTYLSLLTRSDVPAFGRLLPDKLLAGYLILNFLLMFAAGTFTNVLRHGLFYAFLEVFLPYYVASRSIRDVAGFRDALMAFVVAAMVLSALGAFEFAKPWLLYGSLGPALDARGGFPAYVARDGVLRAEGSTTHPIALGYVVAVAAGFFLYLRQAVPVSIARNLGLLLLAVGLLVPLSRGPWAGAAAMLLIFVATGPFPVRRLATLALLGALAVPVLLATTAGRSLVDLLPFVGTVDAESVTYRQRLFDIATQEIMRNPLFGAYDFYYSPAIQELKQGQGIIDIVNSFLGVGLTSGLAGLSLYAGFFTAVAWGIYMGMRNVRDRKDERRVLGRALLATLLGILVIIFTVSSISVIPVIYWSVAGVGVAYARMLSRARQDARTPERFDFRPVAAGRPVRAR